MDDTIPQDNPQGNTTPKTTFIYVLIDPETNEIRYVGKTSHPKKRYYRHMRKEEDTYRTRWITGLKNRDLKPSMQIIEEVSVDCWEERERYWIDFYRTQGSPLTNTATGGKGGSGSPSPETRAKIAAAKKGTKYKPTSEEGRRNMSIAHKGRKMPPEAIAKISAANRGKTASAETRARLSDSHKGQPSAMKGKQFSPEVRAKMSAARRGKKFGPLPEETKRKISEAQIGKEVSLETRMRLSIAHKGQVSAMKGRKQSPEARAKMSLTKRSRNLMKKLPSDTPTLWSQDV